MLIAHLLLRLILSGRVLKGSTLTHCKVSKNSWKPLRGRWVAGSGRACRKLFFWGFYLFFGCFYRQKDSDLRRVSRRRRRGLSLLYSPHLHVSRPPAQRARAAPRRRLHGPRRPRRPPRPPRGAPRGVLLRCGLGRGRGGVRVGGTEALSRCRRSAGHPSRCRSCPSRPSRRA